MIQKVIDAGAVLINGQPTKASYKVRLGDVIRVWLPELADDAPSPEDIPLTIVYEDEAFVVVNKPAGLVTHPAKGNWIGHAGQRPPVPLRHALDRRRREPAGDRPPARPRHLGPPDRRQGRPRPPALATPVRGPDDPQGVSGDRLRRPRAATADYIEQPIGPHPTHREKMAIRLPEDGGKEAVTFYEVLERFDGLRPGPLPARRPAGPTRSASTSPTSATRSSPTSRTPAATASPSATSLGPEVPEADRVLLDRQALHAHSLRLTSSPDRRADAPDGPAARRHGGHAWSITCRQSMRL